VSTLNSPGIVLVVVVVEGLAGHVNYWDHPQQRVVDVSQTLSDACERNILVSCDDKPNICT